MYKYQFEKEKSKAVARKLDTLNWVGLWKLAGRGQLQREEFDGYNKVDSKISSMETCHLERKRL